MKVALIIGGTGGIGYATARLLAERGFKVYATYYRNKEKAELIGRQEKFSMLNCDLKDSQSIEKVLRQILEQEKKIDVIVNTATASLKLKPFERLTIDEFQEDVEVILMGAVRLYQQLIPKMKEQQSGVIINILSSAIVNPLSRMSSYVMAKYGLLGLTKSLQNEVRRSNILIYGISPSFVDTDLIKAFPEKLLELDREQKPGKEFLKPKDIAMLVYDVVNKPENYTPGANIIVESRKVLEYLNIEEDDIKEDDFRGDDSSG